MSHLATGQDAPARSLRILFVSNFYPPSRYAGGYAQLCEEVAQGLHDRGHSITVLTSHHGAGEHAVFPYPVLRLVSLEPDWHIGKSAAWQFFVGRQHRESRAVAQLEELLTRFCPDVIFVWNTQGLPRVMLQKAEDLLDVPVVYYLADYVTEIRDEYEAFWNVPPVSTSAKLLKHPLRRLALSRLRREGKPIVLKYPHCICVSDYLRRRLVSRQVIPADAVVIHNGIELSHFSRVRLDGSRPRSGYLRCLVAGRVEPVKGIHTVIEALAHMQSQGKPAAVELTVLGDGPANYCQQLHSLVLNNHLDCVEFAPPVPRDRMPEVLAGYDVLLLPSEYDEPLARSIQEAMAMGLLVIGTVSGGSGELLRHNHNSLVFQPADARSLAAQLAVAITAPELRVRLARQGQQDVQANFDIRMTVKKIEDFMIERTL